MWPFKKKSAEKTNQNALPAQRIINDDVVTFHQFGSSTVNWVRLISENKKQNDFILIDYFNQLPEVSAPILKFAENMPQVKLYFQDDNGNDIKNNEAIPIVNKFWTKYSKLMTVYDKLLGNVYIEAFSQLTFDSIGSKKLTELFLHPTEYTSIKLKDLVQDLRNIDIKNYQVKVNQDYKTIIIERDNMLHIKNDSIFYNSNGVYGISDLVSCEKNLQAISSGYGARISLYDNGARVIITGKQQANDFASINEDEQTEDIQRKANDTYGRTFGQYQIMVTKVPLDVTNISLNVGELQLNEMNSADFRRICNVFGQDSKIHGDPEATTYDNMDTAESDFYNGSFKRTALMYAKKLTEFINKWYPNFNILCDFSEIKSISNFEAEKEDKLFDKVAKGLMTRNDYLKEIGRNIVNKPEFNEYYVYGNDGKWYPTGQTQGLPNQETQ